jgi:rRNA maturation protein Nop10
MTRDTGSWPLPDPVTLDAEPFPCVACERFRDFQFVQDWEPVDIGGYTIAVYAEYFKCLECGSEHEVTHPDYHPIEDAYKEYERYTGVPYTGAREEIIGVLKLREPE